MEASDNLTPPAQGTPLYNKDGSPRLCRKCGVWLVPERGLDWSAKQNRRTFGGFDQICLSCGRQARKADYAKNPNRYIRSAARYRKANLDRVKAYDRSRDQRLSPDEKRALCYKISVDELRRLVAQGCAVCGKTSGRIFLDHDHSCCESHNRTCGTCLRGALCPTCNRDMHAVDSGKLPKLLEHQKRRWKSQT